jgi:hypothetical protein
MIVESATLRSIVASPIPEDVSGSRRRFVA